MHSETLESPPQSAPAQLPDAIHPPGHPAEIHASTRLHPSARYPCPLSCATLLQVASAAHSQTSAHPALPPLACGKKHRSRFPECLRFRHSTSAPFHTSSVPSLLYQFV